MWLGSKGQCSTSSGEGHQGDTNPAAPHQELGSQASVLEGDTCLLFKPSNLQRFVYGSPSH